MNTEINITQWINRTHGFKQNSEQQQRLNKISNDLLNVALEDAVSSLGMHERECFCIQEIIVPVTIDFKHSIRSQARRWSNAFRKQLVRKQKQNSTSLVHYRSIRHAHIACAEGVLRNDLSRLWAWQQLGVLSINAEDNEKQVLQKWCQQSSTRGLHQIAVWRHLISSPVLHLLIMRLGENHWNKHLDGLAHAMQSNLSLLKTEIKLAFTKQLQALKTDEDNEDFQESANNLGIASKSSHLTNGSIYASNQENMPVLLCSFLQNPYFRSAIYKTGSSPDFNLLTMALALGEPALAGLPIQLQKERLDRLCSVLVTMIKSHENFDVAISNDSFNQKNDVQQVSEKNLLSTDKKTNFDKHSKQEAKQNLHKEDQTTKENLIDIERQLTTYGGLFWLLNLLLQMPEFVNKLTRHKAFNKLPQQWIWFWLARQFLPDSEYKVPAMAFAGLFDYSDFEKIEQEIPKHQQLQILVDAADELGSIFLKKINHPIAKSKQTFYDFIKRKASIERDGPWVEIIFSLDDVNTDVRRAGLDVDPGFIPWLSMVMRFRYA